MAGAVEQTRVRRSLLVGLHGVSTWFVVVMLSAYLSDGHGSWDTPGGVATSAATVTARWTSAPTADALGLFGLLGIVIAVAGPPAYLLWPRVSERIALDGIRRLADRSRDEGVETEASDGIDVDAADESEADAADEVETDATSESESNATDESEANATDAFEWVQDPEPAAVRREQRQAGASNESTGEQRGSNRQPNN